MERVEEQRMYMVVLLCIVPIERQWEEREVDHTEARQQPSGRGSRLQVPGLASDQV